MLAAIALIDGASRITALYTPAASQSSSQDKPIN
jgi:hypothetical protein